MSRIRDYKVTWRGRVVFVQASIAKGVVSIHNVRDQGAREGKTYHTGSPSQAEQVQALEGCSGEEREALFDAVKAEIRRLGDA